MEPSIKKLFERISSHRIVGALGLVGSRARGTSQPSSSDWDTILITRKSACLPQDQAIRQVSSIVEHELNLTPQISDDAVRFAFKSHLISVAVHTENMCNDFTRQFSDGKIVHTEHKHWAIGGRLPEAYAGDLSLAKTFYDPQGVLTDCKKALKSYPPLAQQAIENFCGTETKEKLKALKTASAACSRYDNTVFCTLALAEILRARVRFVFARRGEYFAGFRSLPSEFLHQDFVATRVLEHLRDPGLFPLDKCIDTCLARGGEQEYE